MQSSQTILCGLDEAGRGPLAGPIVGCGVILHTSHPTLEMRCGVKIRDGKLLSSIQREKIFRALTPSSSTVIWTSISVKSINLYGIGWANREIFRRLIRKIQADRYVIDGNLHIGSRNNSKHVQSIVDADATIPEVILAGICAKVIRDRMMEKYDRQYPMYLWKKNFGYGTPDHIRAISTYGTTPFHRIVFVRTALIHKQQKYP